MNTNIDILVRGVDAGYLFFTSSQTIASEDLSVLVDFRDELNYSVGYLGKKGVFIQSSPGGIWVNSLVLLKDSRMRPAFTAFSIFIPAGIKIPGKILIAEINWLQNTYLSNVTNYQVNSRGPWHFVASSVARLRQAAVRCSKGIGWQESHNGYAYTYWNDSAKMFDNLFQPEFGAYDGVFLGNGILNPARRYVELRIDFNNRTYVVQWVGKKVGEPVNLIRTVRISEIPMAVQQFTLNYHLPVNVRLSNGRIDDNMETLTLQYPPQGSFTPQVKQVAFRVNVPQYHMVLITNAHEVIQLGFASMHTFSGDEIGEKYTLQVSKEGFQRYEIEFIPANTNVLDITLIRPMSVLPSQPQKNSSKKKIFFASLFGGVVLAAVVAVLLSKLFYNRTDDVLSMTPSEMVNIAKYINSDEWNLDTLQMMKAKCDSSSFFNNEDENQLKIYEELSENIDFRRCLNGRNRTKPIKDTIYLDEDTIIREISLVILAKSAQHLSPEKMKLLKDMADTNLISKKQFIEFKKVEDLKNCSFSDIRKEWSEMVNGEVKDTVNVPTSKKTEKSNSSVEEKKTKSNDLRSQKDSSVNKENQTNNTVKKKTVGEVFKEINKYDKFMTVYNQRDSIIYSEVKKDLEELKKEVDKFNKNKDKEGLNIETDYRNAYLNAKNIKEISNQFKKWNK